MNGIIKKMEQLQCVLEKRIEEREATFDNRSERWQESEKGEEYQERTDRLQDILDEVTDWQMELSE